MQLKSKKATSAVAALTTIAALGAAGAVVSADASQGPATATTSTAAVAGTSAGRLTPLNNSGVTGRASVRSEGRRIHVRVKARHLAPNLPHAQHIHFGAKARHECPTIADDTDGDFRLTTVEGQPAYGPVRVSLTKKGDTSAASVLAVTRYPTAPEGRVNYARTTRTSKAVARAIRRGDAVVVIHGVDYNNNGEYDFKSAGKSELDKTFPAEATDPATCGVLHRN